MTGMTDIHQHVLWGVDDGPKTRRDMYAMLDMAGKQRIRRIAATPHACPGFQPFDMGLYRERLSEAQAYCNSRQNGIRLMTGSEIAWTFHTVEALRRGQLPTLNGSDYVLIELWRDIAWSEVRNAVSRLLHAGFMPVLAHIERYRCFLWQPDRAIMLKRDMPVCYQVNAPTFIEPNGFMLNRFVRRMLEEQGIDAIASDAHDCSGRAVQMEQAYRALQGKCPPAYVRQMFSFDAFCR